MSRLFSYSDLSVDSSPVLLRVEIAPLKAKTLRAWKEPGQPDDRHLFDDLLPFIETQAQLFDGDLDQALASILKTRCAFAQGDPGNTGEIGDIYSLPPKLWLVRNEVGGRTVMYPEDY